MYGLLPVNICCCWRKRPRRRFTCLCWKARKSFTSTRSISRNRCAPIQKWGGGRRRIGSLKNLKLELAQIRSCGYATNLEEWHEGVHGLGAAIFDRSGAAVAAVGLTGPASRMGEERTRELGQLVLATAEKITRALGGRVRQGL